jgi:hypothetical protein
MVIRTPNVAPDGSRPPAQTRLRRPGRGSRLAICEIEVGLRSPFQLENIAAAHLGGRPSGGRLVRELLLDAQRREIVLLCNQGEISNEVMHRIERDLDLEDARLEI